MKSGAGSTRKRAWIQPMSAAHDEAHGGLIE